MLAGKTTAGDGLWRYRHIAREINPVRVVECQDLTAEMLWDRAENGILYIEEVYGICLDDAGNGRVLNPAVPEFDYISYRGVADVHPGDIILTLCLYNPDTGFEDDILYRWDYVLDTGTPEINPGEIKLPGNLPEIGLPRELDIRGISLK